MTLDGNNSDAGICANCGQYVGTLAVVLNLEGIGEAIISAIDEIGVDDLPEGAVRSVVMEGSTIIDGMPGVYSSLSDDHHQSYVSYLAEVTITDIYNEFLCRVESEALAILKSYIENMPEIIERKAPEVFRSWIMSLDPQKLAGYESLRELVSPDLG